MDISKLFSGLFKPSLPAQRWQDWEVSMHTDQGGRDYNEDCSVFKGYPSGLLLVLCDGLGGHGDGDLASRFFCEQALVYADLHHADFCLDPKARLHNLVSTAAARMGEKILASNSRSDAHTTCAVAWLDKTGVYTAHIGDSRIYGLANTQVKWRSRDHSVTQMLLDDGEITEEEMGTHPDQGKLLKAISVKACPKPNLKVYPPLASGETCLLCSDGFWEMIPAKELSKLSRSKQLDRDNAKAIQLAKKRAGPGSDNITVLLARALS